MKNLIIFSILTYLLFTINSRAIAQNSNDTNSENKKVLKIVLSKIINLMDLILVPIFYIFSIKNY